jgi:hypothetical protein
MAGHPDFGGTPLTHGIDILANGFGVTMAGGQTIAFPPFDITRPGYLLNVEAEFSSVAGTLPMCDVDFNWYDAGMNVHFGHETWRIATSLSGNGHFYTGRGPTKGQLLQLTFHNWDPIQQAQATFWLAETTQHASRDDIRLHQPGVSPVWGNPAGFDPTFNILIDDRGLAVPSGGLTAVIIPLYSGQAQINWKASGQSAANDLNVQITPMSGPANHADIYNVFAGASPFTSPTDQLITMPRKCCLLTVGNTGAATVSLDLSLIAQEYSS